MKSQPVNDQYNSDGYVKKNKMTLKEAAMLVFNLIKISSILEFLLAGWFSSANANDDHLNVENVEKATTEDKIVRKPALCETMRKPAAHTAHAAPSYSERVRKPATDRQLPIRQLV